jgi:hypothetical protein
MSIFFRGRHFALLSISLIFLRSGDIGQGPSGRSFGTKDLRKKCTWTSRSLKGKNKGTMLLYVSSFNSLYSTVHFTLIKKKKNPHIHYKKIQKGAVAK